MGLELDNIKERRSWKEIAEVNRGKESLKNNEKKLIY